MVASFCAKYPSKKIQVEEIYIAFMTIETYQTPVPLKVNEVERPVMSATVNVWLKYLAENSQFVFRPKTTTIWTNLYQRESFVEEPSIHPGPYCISGEILSIVKFTLGIRSRVLSRRVKNEPLSNYGSKIIQKSLEKKETQPSTARMVALRKQVVQRRQVGYGHALRVCAAFDG
jgi:hypothetical protein